MSSKPHKYVKLKALQWLVCAHCGLITLNNARTRAAMNKPCQGGD